MASGMMSALLFFVVLMVSKAGADSSSDGCGRVCAIACLYGNVIDERGCPTCRCIKKPICPLVKCHPCDNGYVYVDGCQTCTCKPVCVPAECPTIKCPYGLQRDEYGCEVCECKPGPVCPLLKCHPCDNGYIYENGCQTCTCKPVCVPAECPTIKCPYGLQRDEYGCEVCACKPGPVCPLLKCHPCDNGYIYENGCQTCTCKPDCVPAECPTIKCPYGLQRDENGCEVCACNPRPVCPPVKCRPCANGYFYVRGCLTCACRPDETPLDDDLDTSEKEDD